MKMLFLFLKIILALALLIGLILGSIIAYATVTDYQPAEEEIVEVKGKAKETTVNDSTLSFLIWNIGYCGLSKEISFFYDGGTTVITPKEIVDKNIEGVKKSLAAYQNTDFVLLQEVDLGSKRSHYSDQATAISSVLKDHAYGIGLNYNVKFVPKPFTNPYGKVLSGLASYSRFQPKSSTRYQFPGNYSWPTSLFFLDRCFLLQRFPTASGKELVVINTHNSAYDDGTLKQKQMDYMKRVLEEEYQKGNYVIVGGDWNQIPPGFDNATFAKQGVEITEQKAVSASYLKGWQWAYDGKIATNRKNDKPFDINKTFTTVIDFFLLSPNIELSKIEGVSNNFEYSDHQGVYMEIKIK